MRAHRLPALAALATLALLLLPLPVGATHVTDGVSWACGFDGGGRSGHPDDCGIDPVGGGSVVQSVGEPEWGPAWIDGDERVLGIEVGGDARAVPVKMLDRHEILNDEVGGVPVAVTYCPLCGSGITFERTVDVGGEARVLDFAPSGFLYKHDLVMWDAQTGTLWTQILGKPIGTLRDGHADADHADARLAVVPTEVTTWDDWNRAHPDGLMLQAVPGIRYGGAYAGYDESCRFGVSRTSDCDVDGLHPKEEVVGVDGPRGAVAFPRLAVLGAGGVAYDDSVGVVVTAGDGATRAFDAGRHTFHASGDGWVDEEGRAWDLRNGTRPGNDEGLPPLESVPLYWFAWREHHPETALWLPEGAGADGSFEGAKGREDNGKLPGFTIPIVAGFLLLVAWAWRRR